VYLQQHRGPGCEVFERAQSRFRTRMQRLRTHAPKMQSSTHRRAHLHAVHACMRPYVSAHCRTHLQVIVTTQGSGEQERCLKLRSQDHPGSSACLRNSGSELELTNYADVCLYVCMLVCAASCALLFFSSSVGSSRSAHNPGAETRAGSDPFHTAGNGKQGPAFHLARALAVTSPILACA
jgi:hypothetical protein